MLNLQNGDCRELLKTLGDNTVDAVITDPPYELGFMGKKWDSTGIAYDPTLWAEVLRVMKPGAYLMAFGGTRTYHRQTVAIEDAGFIIRDCIFWCYGSGFPKSHDISKALDKSAGAEREVIGRDPYYSAGRKKTFGDGNKFGTASGGDEETAWLTAPATDAAKEWAGYGTALKPAVEPIVLAQKPLEGTYAANCLKWNVGALNIDASRIGTQDGDDARRLRRGGFSDTPIYGTGRDDLDKTGSGASGRWPANLLLDDVSAEELDRQSGVTKASQHTRGLLTQGQHGGRAGAKPNQRADSAAVRGHSDEGGASRFFYVAKASKRDRGEGNVHATVKPSQLMKYLVRMVARPGSVILDPFMGSGTTGVAAVAEGYSFIGFELEADSFATATRRIVQPADSDYVQEELLAA